jgi:hypothetical protein
MHRDVRVLSPTPFSSAMLDQGQIALEVLALEAQVVPPEIVGGTIVGVGNLAGEEAEERQYSYGKENSYSVG